MLKEMEERFNSLPELVKLFLDKNIRYKEMVLEYGDWSYYLSHLYEKHNSTIFSWTLRPTGARPRMGREVSEWRRMEDAWDEFVKEWESV